jgi:hypothetical protein
VKPTRCREREIYRLIQKRSHTGWVYLATLLCLFSVTVWGALVTERSGAQHERARATSNAERILPASTRPGAPDSHFGAVAGSRPLFPYSVIPGGVASAQELRNALAHDPIAAAHYAGFDVSQTHVERLANDEEMYVSYRLNGRIYWTRKRLKLLKGEPVITDGKNVARTRCGNRLSAVAVEPTAAKQPLDMTLDPSPLPELASARPIAFPLALPFPSGSSELTANAGSGGVLTPPIFPIAGGGTPERPVIPPSTPPVTPVTPIIPIIPITPPVATPEPGSLVLTAAGIFILLASSSFACFRRRIHA